MGMHILLVPVGSKEVIHLSVGHESILSAFVIGDIVELACVV
jgi:hypothetical protein